MSYFANKGTTSTENSSTTALNNGQTFTGSGVDVSGFGSVVVACKTDQAGALYVDFSPDNSNWDSTLSYTVAASTNEVHRITVTRKYMRVRFTNNSGSNQTYFRLQTMMGSQPHLTSNLNSTLQSDADAIATKSILLGSTYGGIYKFVPVTPEGHLEVAIHSPTLPFGSVHAENLTPVFQTDAVYGLNTSLISFGSGNLAGLPKTSSVSGINTAFVINAGTGAYSQAYLQSRKRLRYRPGQGIVGRFAGHFSTPAMSSYQVAGFGHSEDGIYFGYKNLDFGILYSSRGVREVQTLTFSQGASVAGMVSFRLGSTTLSAMVSNSNNSFKTAYEISNYFAASAGQIGWAIDSINTTNNLSATVVFVANDAGAKSGTMVFNPGSTGATGIFERTLSGSATTEIFYPQSSWNGEPLDGTGPTGVTLDPTKGNVYQLGIQFLGYGPITCSIECVPPEGNGNDAHFINVHTLRIPNTNTQSSFGNPSFPFTAAAYLLSAAPTDIDISISSFAGFIEGEKYLHGPRMTYYRRLVDNNGNTMPTNTLTPLFTVFNGRIFKNRTNESVINLTSIFGAQDSTRPTSFFLIKNGNLTGNVSFSAHSPQSCSYVDNNATAISFTNNEQIIWSSQVGDAGNFHWDFLASGVEDVTLQPGEYITLAVQPGATGSGQSPVTVMGSLNTREDQ